MWLSLALNLEQCSCLKLHIAGMTGKSHHMWFLSFMSSLCRKTASPVAPRCSAVLSQPLPLLLASSCHQESPTRASGRFNGSPSLGRLCFVSDALQGVASEDGCGGASYYQQEAEEGE